MLTRRQLLRSAAAAGLALPLGRVSAAPVTNPSPFTRFPPSLLIKGVNLTFRASDDWQWAFGGTFGGGGQTYNRSWFTDQMDVAVTVGANTIMVTGDLELQLSSQLNSSDYLTRWQQIITDAAARGLYVIVRCAHANFLLGVADGSGVVTEAALVLMENLLNTVKVYQNVIAFDIINEWWAWVVGIQGSTMPHIHQAPITAGQLLTAQATMYTRLKPQTSLPVTFGGAQDIQNLTAALFDPWTPRTNALAYLDYFDFHIYYHIAPADVARGSSYYGSKVVILGEFGSPVSAAGFAGDGCPYANMLSVHATAPNVLGSVAWAAADQNTDPTDMWGLAVIPGDHSLRANGNSFKGFPWLRSTGVTGSTQLRGRFTIRGGP